MFLTTYIIQFCDIAVLVPSGIDISFVYKR